MNAIPVQGGQLPPVAANPVQTGVPSISGPSAFVTAPPPAMPDMSGLTKFGAAVKKYMSSQSQAQGMSAGQAASTASQNAGHEAPPPEVASGAYGTPPPFSGGAPPAPAVPQGGM
jgi:hypothetical protein